MQYFFEIVIQLVEGSGCVNTPPPPPPPPPPRLTTTTMSIAYQSVQRFFAVHGPGQHVCFIDDQYLAFGRIDRLVNLLVGHKLVHQIGHKLVGNRSKVSRSHRSEVSTS